jgi:hypothetical protein
MAHKTFILSVASINVSKTWGCLMLLGAMLIFSGCEHIKNIFGIGGAESMTKMPVLIKSCQAVDPITVHTGDPVTWSFSDNSYVITFDQKFDPNSNQTITPPPGSFSSPTPTTRKWDTSNTPTACSVSATTHKNQGCYFKYSISVGGQVCNDPGVHVVP